ncbi:MAG: glutathione S-transferase family protein, partial [Methylococcales bacterium]
MISLYKFYPAFGLTDPSPFCVKVETFLRMVALPYQAICLTDPRKGPKGKLPFIRDGERTIADSTFVLKYLIDTYRCPIDAELSPEQKAGALALTRMLEEHLYWAIVFERWIDPSNWERIRAQFFGGMPPVIRSVVPVLARIKVKSTLNGQGLGRHSAEEIHALAADDIQAVSDSLGHRDFITGDRPSSYDASVYAFLSSILYCTLDSRAKKVIFDFANLKRYCERVRQAY